MLWHTQAIVARGGGWGFLGAWSPPHFSKEGLLECKEPLKRVSFGGKSMIGYYGEEVSSVDMSSALVGPD